MPGIKRTRYNTSTRATRAYRSNKYKSKAVHLPMGPITAVAARRIAEQVSRKNADRGFQDHYISNRQITGEALSTRLTNIAVGDGTNQRQGDDIKITSISFRLTVALPSLVGTAPVNLQYDAEFRVMLIRFKEYVCCDISVTALADAVLDTSVVLNRVFSPYRKAQNTQADALSAGYIGPYDILYDQRGSLGYDAIGTAEVGGIAVSNGSTKRKLLKYTHRFSTPANVKYATSAVNSNVSGNIYFLILTNNVPDTITNVVNCEYGIRTNFLR